MNSDQVPVAITALQALATLTHVTEDCGLDFTLARSPYTDVPVLYVSTAR